MVQFLALGALALSYLIAKTIYRLYFHPLSHIPGPRLAACTSLYNAYHDVVGDGIVKMFPEFHERYGPVVRIQPNEVHVSTLSGYNQIHRVNTSFDRIWHDNPFLTGSLQSLSTLPETRKRREFISPFFSKAAISRVEPSLHGAKVSQFLTTLASADASVVDFFLAFRCLTADVVMDYCFHSSLNALTSPGFKNHTVETFVQGSDMALVATFFPLVFSVLNFFIFSLPEKARAKYFATVHGFETMQNMARVRVEDALRRADADQGEEKEAKAMFDAMANPDKSKGQIRPTKEEMVADGCLMIAAGTDTTGNTLGTILWHVTQNPDIEKKLLEELKAGIGKDEVVQSSTLEGEGFEYLRAVVKEGLRLSYGVPGRIIRRVPKSGQEFEGVFVPGGAVVTSSIYMQNTNPLIFPDPLTFDPERWLCDAETYRTRDKSMLSFSRGSRSCIGMNLAIATLHLTVAHMFRRFEIKTNGYTTARDMEWRDCFVTSTLGHIRGLVSVREE